MPEGIGDFIGQCGLPANPRASKLLRRLNHGRRHRDPVPGVRLVAGASTKPDEFLEREGARTDLRDLVDHGMSACSIAIPMITVEGATSSATSSRRAIWREMSIPCSMAARIEFRHRRPNPSTPLVPADVTSGASRCHPRLRERRAGGPPRSATDTRCPVHTTRTPCHGPASLHRRLGASSGARTSRKAAATFRPTRTPAAARTARRGARSTTVDAERPSASGAAAGRPRPHRRTPPRPRRTSRAWARQLRFALVTASGPCARAPRGRAGRAASDADRRRVAAEVPRPRRPSARGSTIVSGPGPEAERASASARSSKLAHPPGGVRRGHQDRELELARASLGLEEPGGRRGSSGRVPMPYDRVRRQHDERSRERRARGGLDRVERRASRRSGEDHADRGPRGRARP